MYANQIKLIAPLHDARHIEAYMRSECGTLDYLKPSQFKAEVVKAVECIEIGGEAFAEKIAKSYGM